MTRKSFLSIVVSILLSFIFIFLNCLPALKDITPPFCELLHPVGGSSVNGVVPIVVSATDNEEITEMRIYIDGKLEFVGTGQVQTFTWDTAPIADNLQHYIRAIAFDKENNIGYSLNVNVQVVPGNLPDPIDPTINILTPLNGQLVSGLVNYVAEPKDNTQIERVDFFVDGDSVFTDKEPLYKYVWDTGGLVKGADHNLFVIAYDINGNSSASPTITVTVNNNEFNDLIPPSLALLYPVQNSIFSESGDVAITIIADATDENGIKKVEFSIDGELMHTDSMGVGSSYKYDWSLQGYGDGAFHSIFVKAFDNAGNTSATQILVTITP
jgi:hypothetical protein